MMKVFKYPIYKYSRNNLHRTKAPAKWGENIQFIADYLFLNPGATSREVRVALCERRGIEWEGGTKMRGQYTSYFSGGAVWGYHSPAPCGRYWTRMKRPDGRNGYMLTMEGLCKVGIYNEDERNETKAA
jgi:hypothetical protein|tara:strand:- start:446 stop:832 length:387 start_codon:yes stop_codon:yes gene_type:complete